MFAQSYDAEMSGDGNGYQWIVDDVSVSLDSFTVCCCWWWVGGVVGGDFSAEVFVCVLPFRPPLNLSFLPD